MKLKYSLIVIAVIVIIAVFAFYEPNNIKKYPYFVYTDGLSFSGYVFADEHNDILIQFDCYCGCYNHIGHANLRDCFIFKGNFESHASYCDVCKALNQKIQKGIKDGKTIDTIKNKLELEYL